MFPLESDAVCATDPPQVLDRWYGLYPNIETAKQVASALVKEKWDVSQMGELWDCAGAFKSVWKSFTLPELGKLVQGAIRNGRKSFSSYYNEDSDSVSERQSMRVHNALCLYMRLKVRPQEQTVRSRAAISRNTLCSCLTVLLANVRRLCKLCLS